MQSSYICFVFNIQFHKNKHNKIMHVEHKIYSKEIRGVLCVVVAVVTFKMFISFNSFDIIIVIIIIY